MNPILEWLSNIWNALATEGDFQPHYFCLSQSDGLIWTMFTGDMMVFISYMILPYLIWTCGILGNLAMSIRVLFGSFIVFCGVSHLLMAFNLWHGFYWLEAVEKNVTGVVSLVTAVLLGGVLRGIRLEVAITK